MKFTSYEGLTFDDVLIEPAYSDINSRNDITLTQDFLGFHMWLPIISANMDYITEAPMMGAMRAHGGLGILHRFAPWSTQLEQLGSLHNYVQEIPAAFSVGTRDIAESMSRIKDVVEFPNTLKNPIATIDIAHGHHDKAIKLVAEAKSTWPLLYVIAGNVATAEGAFDLIVAGADAIKVGIGPGSVCTTRTVTGVGVPQLSAIANVAEETRIRNIPLIADGGIRNSGDIVKALIAGADAVMIGHLLAGTTETPGNAITGPDGTSLWKPYRGQSIFGSNGDRFTKEGISGFVREKGPVANVLKNLAGGIRSGMSYVGARNLVELRDNARFIKVSGHTMSENNTRVAEVIN